MNRSDYTGCVNQQVLRGKYLFTFGDHGGVIVAVPYRRYTKTLRLGRRGRSTKVFGLSDYGWQLATYHNPFMYM